MLFNLIDFNFISHAFVFVILPELGYYIVLTTYRNEGNHCETTK